MPSLIFIQGRSKSLKDTVSWTHDNSRPALVNQSGPLINERNPEFIDKYKENIFNNHIIFLLPINGITSLSKLLTCITVSYASNSSL